MSMKFLGRSIVKYGMADNVFKIGRLWLCTDSNSQVEVEYNHLSESLTSHLLPTGGHRVIILQPARTRGQLYLEDNVEEQSLLEARALINTLGSWTVIEEERVNMRSINVKTFFSKGVYNDLIMKIRDLSGVSAVLVNWSFLSFTQRMNLEKDFQKMIYDRYLMVLQIFKLHAKTTEAKLQVQLAEIPYFRTMLQGFHRNTHSQPIVNEINKSFNGIPLSTSSMEDKYFLLKIKEHSIKGKLKELELSRDIHRSTRKKNDLPIISVVGYTNAGKTSLIRHLTKDTKVQPKDCFFATLDVTYHDFYMKLHGANCGMTAIILDTIGFLSEIPTDLIAAFHSTLRETVDTDLLIHVVDISSSYWKQQMECTLKTLATFSLPQYLLDSMITVGTKIDCINPADLESVKASVPNFVPISNVSGENIDTLLKRIVEGLHGHKSYITKQIKVDQSTSVYQWLLSNAVIQNREIARDGHKLLLDVMFTPAMWDKFQSKFHPRK